MTLLDGKALSAKIKEEIRADVDSIVNSGKRPPHLAAVLIGDDPASHAYVGNKVKSCEFAGFRSTLIHHDASVTQEVLMEIVGKLNADPEVDGFIVQRPLPKHLDADAVTMAIRPEKDVDGFHPVNLGRMTIGLPAYLPATPFGILQMLERYRHEGAAVPCDARSRRAAPPATSPTVPAAGRYSAEPAHSTGSRPFPASQSPTRPR
jgi:methylenetetrahydrofolate dehydrogenase (NADP+)/methenyltetrahydrofolate cyclohydrolase